MRRAKPFNVLWLRAGGRGGCTMSIPERGGPPYTNLALPERDERTSRISPRAICRRSTCSGASIGSSPATPMRGRFSRCRCGTQSRLGAPRHAGSPTKNSMPCSASISAGFQKGVDRRLVDRDHSERNRLASLMRKIGNETQSRRGPRPRRSSSGFMSASFPASSSTPAARCLASFRRSTTGPTISCVSQRSPRPGAPALVPVSGPRLRSSDAKREAAWW